LLVLVTVTAGADSGFAQGTFSKADPSRADQSAVSVAETADSFTLDNGIIAANITKRSGTLTSLVYRGMQMLNRQGGYWSHAATSSKMIQRITIDPQANDGERGEVSVKGISGGKPMGSGPGGSTVADIEIRYALGRGDSGIYTYSIFEHKPDYPATAVGEARYCAKLNDDIFD